MSTDADAAVAVGEAIGAVLEQLNGATPDLAVLFVSGDHVRHLSDLAAVVHATISPEVMLAVSASGVIGGSREAEGGSGVSLWAGVTGDVRPLRLEWLAGELLGLPDDLAPGSTLLLLADPFSFDNASLDGRLSDEVAVVGGLLSSASDAAANRLWVDGVEHRDGAIGVVFPPGVGRTIVSQGCRRVGSAWTITAAERNLIKELAGRPAIERLNQMIASLSPADRLAAARGLRIGLVINDEVESFGRDDFLIRRVNGIEQRTQALAVDAEVSVGQVVQFHVRDADSATVDLWEVIAESSGYDRIFDGAMVFVSADRGTKFFGEPHRDAEFVREFVDGGVAGMFTSGELGPVGDRNARHEFTTTVLGLWQLR